MVILLSWIGLREGRLREKFDESASDYIYGRRKEEQNLLFDAHLWIHKAHVVMLGENEVIPLDEAIKILEVLRDLNAEDVELDPRLGDVYTNTERYMIEKIGDVAGAMHTGRSRNDLSATAMRILARDWIIKVINEALMLQESLMEKSEIHLNTIMPGYTHLQQAQPITFAHWAMAYHDFLLYDIQRLEDAYKRTNNSTLGAAAFAGTGHLINRTRTAELLGFDDVLENSLQCVSSRDYLLEIVFSLTLMMNTINRLHEDIFLWTTTEFGFVELDDSLAGTSSIMPQKKNPLLQETARGRAATQIGRLTAALTVFKDLPMGHNFDMYEAGLILKESVKELQESIIITKKVIDTLKVNVERMEEILNESYITATELADVLVRESNIPFRASHQIIGNLVRKAIEENISLSEVSVKMLNDISLTIFGRKTSLTQSMIKDATNPRINVMRRKSIGGPAPSEVKRMIDGRKPRVIETRRRQTIRLKKIEEAQSKLEDSINHLISEYK
jgi:argininosuccinate lyase